MTTCTRWSKELDIWTSAWGSKCVSLGMFGLPHALPEVVALPLFAISPPLRPLAYSTQPAVITAPCKGIARTWPARSFQARFFCATIFYTSRLVVWKGATASVLPTGCKNKCGHCIPTHTLVWGGPISLSRWCGWQRVRGAGAGVFEREDRCPRPWQRGCRAPFHSKRPSGVAPVGGQKITSGSFDHLCTS